MLAQNVYYVAPNGNDANAGELSSPWASIQQGIDTLSEGDTLFLRGGTYNQYNLSTGGISGHVGNFIVIKAYANESPVIDGGDNSQILNITGSSYLLIEGIEFTNANTRLIWIGDDSSYVTIRDCYFHNSGHPSLNTEGIKFAPPVHEVILEYNTVHNTGMEGFDGVTCDDCIFRNNHIYNIANGWGMIFKGGG